MSDRSEMLARYEARFPGWRKSAAPKCPRPVAGKRCLSGRAHRRDCPACQAPWTSSIFDHARSWIDDHGQRVLTLEPYGVNEGALADLLATCTSLGLTVEVSPDSPWNPGRTTLLVVRKNTAE